MNDYLVELAAVVVKLLAQGPKPSGHLYATVMRVASLSDYQTALGALTVGGFVTVDGTHMVRLTGKGQSLV